MGGGGGDSGSQAFKAVGTTPNFDYQTAMGLQQLAIGGDIQSYALSDADFANRYPALQDAYNTYQANLGQQVGQVQQGQDVQSQLMGGLAGQIAGRQGTQTTGDINNLRNAAATAAGAVQPMYNLGASQAGLAQPLIGMGQQQAGLANPLMGMAGQINQMGGQQGQIGQGINRMGNQLAQAAQTPYQIGQQLLNEPIDPQAQQQMMRAGLGSAAGALGAASLGQGMAGQSAAARQLGLNTLQYGQQMRGEAMQDINQYSSMLGAAGQMKGLGGQTIAGGANTIGLGGQTVGLAGNQIAQGANTLGLAGQQMQGAANTYGAGAGVASQAGGLYGSAQNMQEQYQMDTGQLAGIYGGLQSQQAQNLLQGIGTSGQLFQKRPFGLGGANLAQSEMGQAGAYNSFQQANYATMNGIAYNGAQMQAQQNQLKQQQQASQTGAMISTGTTAAVTGATVAAMSCWVARAVYGTADNRWKHFRHWMLNIAPVAVRRCYLRYGEAVSYHARRHASLRWCLRLVMDPIIARTNFSATLTNLGMRNARNV